MLRAFFNSILSGPLREKDASFSRVVLSLLHRPQWNFDFRICSILSEGSSRVSLCISRGGSGGGWARCLHACCLVHSCVSQGGWAIFLRAQCVSQGQDVAVDVHQRTQSVCTLREIGATKQRLQEMGRSMAVWSKRDEKRWVQQIAARGFVKQKSTACRGGK